MPAIIRKSGILVSACTGIADLTSSSLTPVITDAQGAYARIIQLCICSKSVESTGSLMEAGRALQAILKDTTGSHNEMNAIELKST